VTDFNEPRSVLWRADVALSSAKFKESCASMLAARGSPGVVPAPGRRGDDLGRGQFQVREDAPDHLSVRSTGALAQRDAPWSVQMRS
jgi:hypothetical protein